MNSDKYMALHEDIAKIYSMEIDFYENLTPCRTGHEFAIEAIWVILCSGMKEQIARKIKARVVDAILCDLPASSVFGHKGKGEAIDKIWKNRETLFEEYRQAEDKIAFLQDLPWIGPVTKYHLAKNLGIDTMKPDRHLVRIAESYGKNPFQLCRELSEQTGFNIATIDYVLWRAANLGWI